MLILIASYPRSGNTFFRIALRHLFGCKSAPEHGARKANPSPEEFSGREHWLWTDLTNRQMHDATETYFAKTHDPPDASLNGPAIYIARDGRDALVSYAWYSLIQHRGLGRERIDEPTYREALFNVMMDRRSPYGVWSDHVLAWLARPNTAIVRFEELVRAPEESVSSAMEQLGLTSRFPPIGREVPTFSELKARRPEHYRRGQVGSWRDEFPPDLLRVFWQHHGRAMEALGFARDRQAATGAEVERIA